MILIEKSLYQEYKLKNLKVIILNYVPEFSDGFTVIIDEISHIVKISGSIPSKSHLIFIIQPGRHKIRIQPTKFPTGFLREGTLQEFDLHFEHGIFYHVEYGLNQKNQSSQTIREVLEPFDDPDDANIFLESQEQNTVNDASTIMNQLASKIRRWMGKIQSALSF